MSLPGPHDAWLAQRAEQSPRAEALRAAEVALDYEQLWRGASAIAHALAARGVASGAPIAVLASGSLEIALLLHAAQALGAVLVPLNARLGLPELRRQIALSGARAIVSDAAESERADALAYQAGIGSLRIAAGAGEPARLSRVIDGPLAARASDAVQAAGEERALLWLFTSGTSGTPRAAELSQRALRASARGHTLLVGLAPGERWLACLPMFHIGGLSILVRCTHAGASAELHDRFDPGEVATALASGRISHVSLVPTMLARLLDAWGELPPPPALRCVLLGGAAAPPRLLERAVALGFPVAPTYGLTEAASQVATRLPSERRAPLPGRLRALPGTALRIVDDRGMPVPHGADGEICVRGPTLMTRWVDAPDATRRTLRSGWLHTGDSGRLDAEGGLTVLDRRTDLIVSGGENVYPAEIEAALCEHPAVLEAGVVGRTNEEFGARPVAWVALRAGAQASESALRAHCAARLARFKLPVAYRFSEALPRNAAGKLLRRELREREQHLPLEAGPSLVAHP